MILKNFTTKEGIIKEIIVKYAKACINIKTNKMRKNIDLSNEAVKAITIQAINEDTVFKLKAEQILEDYAKPFMALKKPKRAVAKSKK